MASASSAPPEASTRSYLASWLDLPTNQSDGLIRALDPKVS